MTTGTLWGTAFASAGIDTAVSLHEHRAGQLMRARVEILRARSGAAAADAPRQSWCRALGSQKCTWASSNAVIPRPARDRSWHACACGAPTCP